MDAVTRTFQHRAQESANRSLPVGAGDMNYRRNPPLGMTELRQQALDAIQYEVDALGMKRQQPFKYDIAAIGWACHLSAGINADSPPVPGCRVRTRSNFLSASFSSRRSTIMSIMPCSSRYSARWNPSGNRSRI